MGNVTNDFVNDIDSSLEYESFTCDPERCSTIIPNSNCSHNILLQNIRSINCNFNSLITLISQINIEIDVIVLTECWLSVATSTPQLAEYDTYSTKKTNILQNDGVTLYIKKNITNLITEEPAIVDGNCLIAKFGNDTAIVAIYRSPSYHNITNFLESLAHILQNLTQFKNVYLIGDLNVDIKSGNIDHNSQEYLTFAACFGYLPTHFLPTRKANCLDHILAKTNIPIKTFVLNSSVTDHNSVLLCLQKCYNKSYAVTKRTTLQNDGVVHDLDNLDLTPIYGTDDVNISTEYLISSLTKIIERNTHTSLLSRRNKIIKPWITPGLLRCIRHRDKLHIKLTKNPENNILKISYFRYRNYCNNLLKKLKRQYEQTQIQNAGQNTKKMWKVIKNITNTTNTNLSAHQLISNTATAADSVNSANRFFVNIGRNLAEKAKLHNNKHLCYSQYPSRMTISHSFALFDTDESEVEKIIMALRNDCATGIDKIPCSFIKKFKQHLIPPLTYLFNQCFFKGIFPHILKKALIRPVHKNGDKSCVDNYRPIAILPSISKILERLIYNRLIKYLEKNELLATTQYGFRSNKSTDDAVHELTDYIVRHMDSKKKCVAIFLDLAKAFDTVSIPILLVKLHNLGIRGNAHNLLKSYLTDRTQRVKIDYTVSKELPIEYGVPQGSILGPLLFLVFINDLCLLNLPNDSKIVSYADDTALLFSAENWTDTFTLAQTGFDTVTEWLTKNLLTLNTDKTKYMTFSYNILTQPTLNSHSIVAHNCYCSGSSESICMCPKLSSTNTMKYLGITIDRYMNFKAHIETLTARVRKLIYIFKNLRHVASGKLLKTVYLSLCQSLISYCITSWGGTHKTSLLSLEIAQRAILKVSTFRSFRFPTAELLAKCDVLSVRQLFILLTVRKKHSLIPYIPTLQTSKRRVDIVCPPELFRKAHSHRFFCFLGTSLYNKINRSLHIYPMNKYQSKKTIQNWLKGLSYSETENLITVVT